MAYKDLETLLNRGDLVCQKDTSMQGVQLKTNKGEVIQVVQDGCAVVSLYNALRLNNSQKSFENFAADLAANKCLENGGINWKTFNRLQYDLRFTWMQDAELSGCDQVNIDHLSSWISSGAVALVKLQSFYGRDRRHFMMALGVEGDMVRCLESSDISGVPKLRDITGSEVLGVYNTFHEGISSYVLKVGNRIRQLQLLNQ